jgi:hypothetical protein
MSKVAQFVLDNPDSVKDMAKDVRRWIKKAASDTMNEIAFKARINIIEKASQSMIIRNNFLTSPRVLSVTKVPFGHTESLKDIKASVGFTEAADFMRRQDEGGWHEAEEGKHLRIFTDNAREGGVKTGRVQKGYGYTNPTQMRRKMILAEYRPFRGSIQKYRHFKGSSRETRLVRKAAVAYKSGLLMFFKRSLYRITKFEKKGDSVHFEKQMIINREYIRTFTPTKDFFLPACQEAAKDIQRLFNEKMDSN